MSYFDIKAVSNSSLNYIDPESGGNPRLFRKFLDGQLDEKPSKSFEIGTLIHEELLEPGKLDIVPDNIPGPKTQDIIDRLWQRLYEDVGRASRRARPRKPCRRDMASSYTCRLLP